MQTNKDANVRFKYFWWHILRYRAVHHNRVNPTLFCRFDFFFPSKFCRLDDAGKRRDETSSVHIDRGVFYKLARLNIFTGSTDQSSSMHLHATRFWPDSAHLWRAYVIKRYRWQLEYSHPTFRISPVENPMVRAIRRRILWGPLCPAIIMITICECETNDYINNMKL
jgi:hypothetical protein